MRRMLVLAAVIALFAPIVPTAQGPDMEVAEWFKVGTFDIHGVPHVGLVLRDSLVIDIEVANMALESDPAYPTVPMPRDMLELIGRWDYGLKYRLYEIVNHVVGNDLLMGAGRADYIYDVSDLRTRPPIMYPGKILNAAVNFYSHVNEAGSPEERAAEQRRRREERGVPYLFLKPSRGAVVGNGDSDRHSSRPRPDRLGGRARGGDRTHREVRVGERRAGLRVRLHSVDRRLRPRRPAAGGQRHPLGLVRGQGPRQLRAAGTVDRAEGVLRRSDGEPPADAQRRRPDAAGRAGRRHDPLAVGDHRVRLVDHHALSG